MMFVKLGSIRACGWLFLWGSLLMSSAGCNSTSANGESNHSASGGKATNGTSTSESTSAEEPTGAAEATTPAAATPAAATPAPNMTFDITFDDIKFPHKPDQPYDSALLTKKVLSYVSRNVRLRGYILPTYQNDGIKSFVLVRDNQECCFGPGAALFDCVRVEMRGDKTVSFSPRPVAVEGEFLIEEARDYKGVTRAVFYMRATEVTQ